MDLVETELEVNVATALRDANVELLPNEVRNSYLARWVLNFDSLVKSREPERYSENDDSDPLVTLVSQLVQSVLAANIPFYFASLFHLGRQWQVSSYTLDAVEKAQQKDYLQATVSQNISVFKEQLTKLEIPRHEQVIMLSEALEGILSFSQQKHSQMIEKAQQWWHFWQRDVSELMEITERLSKEFNDYRYRENRNRGPLGFSLPPSLIRLMGFSFQTRQLYRLLSQEGIKFKNILALNPTQNILSNQNWLQMILLSIVSGGYEGESFRYLERFMDVYREVLRSQQEMIEQQRYQPVIQQIEAQLLKEFESENPFDKYALLKCPPDFFLKDLWNKCKVPDSREGVFFYAKRWKASLESEPSFWNQDLSFKELLTDSDIKGFARSADSTIKNRWCSEARKVHENENEFAQRLFEKYWVVEMAKGAVNPSRTKKGKQEWSVESFRAMIRQVVTFINTLGYELETPSSDRIKELWDLLIKGNSYDLKW